jgi:hypothetical protein
MLIMIILLLQSCHHVSEAVSGKLGCFSVA